MCVVFPAPLVHLCPPSWLYQYAAENQRWLVDAVIRLMCVFALDKFADFVSDQVSVGGISRRELKGRG